MQTSHPPPRAPSASPCPGGGGGDRGAPRPRPRAAPPGGGGAGVETHRDHLEIERTFETDAESSTPSRPVNRRARAGDSFDTVAARSYHPPMGPPLSRLPPTPRGPAPAPPVRPGGLRRRAAAGGPAGRP